MMPAADHAALLVDAHAHVMRRDLPLASGRHSAPKRDVTVEEYIGVLDAHHVARGVLTAPSFYGADNSLLLAALDAYPSRLRGTVIVSPDVSPATLALMDRRGVVGIRLNWIRRATLPDVTSYRRLLTLARDLDWHVEIFLEGPKLALVLPHLRSAGVKVVVDHFGAPDPALGVADPGFRAVLAGMAAGDTWVKLSAPYRLGGADPRPYVDALLAAAPHRLVWASDWPFVSFEERVTYRQTLAWLAEWIPDAATRTLVAATTPARLFRFERAPGPPRASGADQ